MTFLDFCTIVGAIGLGTMAAGYKKIIEFRKNYIEKDMAEATVRINDVIAEITYYRYRDLECSSLSSQELIAYLEKRYQCKALTSA